MIFSEPMIQAIRGTSMLPVSMTEWSRTRNVGLCFIEESELVKRYIDNARRYFDHVCGGSTWNAQILRESGLESVSSSIQGVDIDYFKPGPDPRNDVFYIFSGGKMEWRKGTDIAMKAIGIMMQRHSDVYAVTAWHNPWKQSLDTMAASPLLKWDGDPLHAIDEAGIDRSRLLGPLSSSLSNANMLPLYQKCHVGVFPNRVEGGTNMVMCEFMACGKPVVAMRQHGHADVVRESRFNLRQTKELVSAKRLPTGELIPVARYWEPDVDEVVSTLEYAYKSREVARNEGLHNREAMKPFTWENTAKSLLKACVA